MERRQFFKKTAAVSACALAGAMVPSEASAEASGKYKITVIRKSLNEEFSIQDRGEKGNVCDAFEEGQEFVLDHPWSPPEGFCPWAWADIRPIIMSVHAGKFSKFTTCCTDGYRPVYFRVEKV